MKSKKSEVIEMTINTINQSQRKAARVAGFTFLFAIAIVVFANYGISFRLSVPGNAAETARNIMAHETLFRINIACDLIYVMNIVVLLATLYVVLKPVNRHLALVAAFFMLVYALMWVVTAFGNNSLRLKVFFKNYKAISFYEKYGFKNVRSEITDIGNNYAILDNIMIKELKSEL